MAVPAHSFLLIVETLRMKHVVSVAERLSETRFPTIQLSERWQFG